MRTVTTLFCSAAIAGSILVGCGGGSTKTIKTDNGNVQVSTSNKLPDNFPSDFPVYKNASVQGSYSGTQNGITGNVVTWQSGDSFDDVSAYYTSQFKSGPWKASTNGTIGDSAYWAGENSDATKAFYIGVSKGDKTSIIASVGDQDKSSSSSSDTPTESASEPTSSTSSSTPAASSTLPAEATLPSDFPKDRVPFPSGARVTQASSVSSGGQKSHFVELYIKDTPANAADYFKTELPKHGWTQTLTTESNGEFFATFTGGTSDAATVTSMASDTAGYAQVTLTVTIGG